MTQPKQARARGSKRFYTWRGTNAWSATTIIGGGVPKPALPRWSAKSCAEFAMDNLKTLQELERDAGVDLIKGAPWRMAGRAADLGTSIHAAIDAHNIGKPMPEWEPEIRQKMQAFGSFVEDFEPEFLMSEATVFNRTESYAGTLDAIIRLSSSSVSLLDDADSKTYLMDVKTGKGVYPETALQLAAYRYAEFVCAPDGSEQAIPPIDGGCVLHLTDAGYDLIEVVCDEAVFRAFLYAREVFRWSEETSKGVLLPSMRPVPRELAA